MTTFLDYIETQETIDEAIITLGKKLYPRDGNVVIMSGGAASGKGFVSNKLLGLEGKVLDTDFMKTLAQKSSIVKAKAKELYGIDIETLDLKNAKNVSVLHKIISDLGISDKKISLFLNSALASNIKPNIIFDVTLKNMTKLDNISTTLDMLNYAKKNRHIVWVLNDFEIAKQQNATRSRVVSNMILKDTHLGSMRTMLDLVNLGKSLEQYIDGDIWVVFNKRHEDTKLNSSDTGGSYVESANMFKIKEAGKSVVAIPDDILNKIKQYAPKDL